MPIDSPRLSWGHVNINVRDLDRSVAFYEKLGFHSFMPTIPYLGLTSEPGTRALPEPVARALGLASGMRGRACILQLGDGFPMLDLTEFASHEAREPLDNADIGIVRICLASQDLHADHARLSGEGVEFLSEPLEGEGGLADVAVCVDPDGTRIELIQIHLDRWGPLLGGD